MPTKLETDPDSRVLQMLKKVFLVFPLAILLSACGGGGTGAADRSGTPEPPTPVTRTCDEAARLTIPPIDLNRVLGITPLGDTRPPDFTLPRIATEWFTGDPDNPPASPETVVSPGSIRIIAVEQVSYSGGSRPYTSDYSVFFALCADVSAYLEHLGSLDAGFAALIGDFSAAPCTTEVRSSETLTRCRKTVAIDRATGDALGTASPLASIEFGSFDARLSNSFANPARYPDRLTASCPMSHYEPAAATAIYLKVGSADGPSRRSAEPLCGELNQDQTGTAQGNWVLSSFDSSQPLEAQALALVDDPVASGQGMFSIGLIGSLLDGRRMSFLTAETGLANRPFSAITADDNIYCYDLDGEPILLQLLDDGSLRFEAVDGNACGDIAQVFSANMRSFIR